MSFTRRFPCPSAVALILLTLGTTALLLLVAFTRPAAAQANSAPSAIAATQPRQQAYTFPPDKLAKAIALSRIRNILDIAGSLWGIVFLWLLLALRAWARIEAWAQRRSSRRWLQGVRFFFVFIILTSLASLPLDIYGQHASRSFGISVESWASWFGDQGKALGLALVLGTPILLLFNWIVRRWPRRYWFGAWLATIPILLVILFVEPVVIEPLFDKFEPLARSNPALANELEQIVARTGTNIPPDRMFLMKASLKTNGLNAYVSGIGATKRIVVWDTTAGRIPDDEVLFIFGHESGHYVLNHIWKGFAGSVIGLFFVFWACAALAKWLVNRFGVRWGISRPEMFAEWQPPLATRTGFVVLLFVISIAGFVLEPASNAFSRHFEHQADIYGQEAIHGIVPDPETTAVSAFNHLGEAWLDDPAPNPFIEFWLFSHPSTQHRAEFAAHYDPWANGGRGKYFGK